MRNLSKKFWHLSCKKGVDKFTALNNPDVSGHIANAETGEALIIVEEGNVTYIAPDTLIKMLDDIFKEDPMLAMGLAAALVDIN